jgi:hypothetical protein
MNFTRATRPSGWEWGGALGQGQEGDALNWLTMGHPVGVNRVASDECPTGEWLRRCASSGGQVDERGGENGEP